MRLIIRSYLESLRERDELDAIIPVLLSEMGLTVFSRPRVGTRQDGVDVAAVGNWDEDTECVYLFSIKSGNLTRSEWNGNSNQALRPSLDEIRDSYIPNRLPKELHGKPIRICLVMGGDVGEAVRPDVTGYIKANSSDSVSYQEWNGDKLADLIGRFLLREELLPKEVQPAFRKALALLDEPEASHRHFVAVIRSLADHGAANEKQRLTALRQMVLCVWILYAWARDAENLDCPYRGAEYALLRGWQIVKAYDKCTTQNEKDAANAYQSLMHVYNEIATAYLEMNVFPCVGVRHGLSSAVGSGSSLDVSLRLFDVLGRLGMQGLWVAWCIAVTDDGEDSVRQKLWNDHRVICDSIAKMINNNRALLLPVMDEHAIDICIASMCFAIEGRRIGDIAGWHKGVIDRIELAYQAHGAYPCSLNSYHDLLSHPEPGNEEYRKRVTEASTLLPMLAVWAAVIKNGDAYSSLAKFKSQEMRHSNWQMWLPDSASEDAYYDNSEIHGKAVCDIPVESDPSKLLAFVKAECEKINELEELTAMRRGFWPLIIIASRYYRLPVPMHFLVSGVEPEPDSI